MAPSIHHNRASSGPPVQAPPRKLNPAQVHLPEAIAAGKIQLIVGDWRPGQHRQQDRKRQQQFIAWVTRHGGRALPAWTGYADHGRPQWEAVWVISGLPASNSKRFSKTLARRFQQRAWLLQYRGKWSVLLADAKHQRITIHATKAPRVHLMQS